MPKFWARACLTRTEEKPQGASAPGRQKKFASEDFFLARFPLHLIIAASTTTRKPSPRSASWAVAPRRGTY